MRTQKIAVDIAGRALPSVPEVEASILESLLTDPSQLEIVRAVLPSEEAFHQPRHREVYRAILALVDEGILVDIHTIGERLKAEGRLQDVGGLAALSELLTTVPTSPRSIEQRAKHVRASWQQRKVIEACQLVAAEGYTWPNPATFGQHARSTIDAATEGLSSALFDQIESLDSVLDRHLVEIAQQWAAPTTQAILSTGLNAWDDLIGGLRPGKLHAVAGLTGHGKTALTLCAATTVAAQVYEGERAGVLMISGEMSATELVDRQLARLSGLSEDQIRTGPMRADEWGYYNHNLEEARVSLAGLPMLFVYGQVTHEEVRGLCRVAQQRWDHARQPGEPRTRLRLVIVDYLQLMRMSTGRRTDRYEAIGEYSQALKRLAGQLEVHVLELVQFNRKAYDPGTDPSASQADGSSAIEKDADLFSIVRIATPKDVEADGRLKDWAEIRLDKGRGRARGKRWLKYEGSLYRFLDGEPQDHERWQEAWAAVQSSKRAASAGPRRSRWAPRNPSPSPGED